MTAAQAQVPPIPTPAPTDDAEALMQNRLQTQEQLAPLQAANPFSQAGVAVTGTAPNGPFAQAMQVLQSPPVQAYLRVFSQPPVQETAQRLAAHPHRLNLLYSEMAWVLVFLIFRAWRRSKARNFASRLWIGLYTFVLGTLVGGVAIPYAWLGADYLTLATACFEASQEAASVWLQQAK